MIVTIHQPEHLPWLGFFNKAANCDKLVLLDTVQYEKNYFQNRNRIISSKSQSFVWLTMPVNKGSLSDTILQKTVKFDKSAKRKYLEKIKQTYSSYPFYREHIHNIEKIIFESGTTSLSIINTSLIKYIINFLQLRCEIISASELEVGTEISGTELLCNICKKTEATTYLSGIYGKKYLSEKLFINNKINVEYQTFIHPEYKQPSETFVSHLSVLDLIFSFNSQECYDIIRSGYTLKES